MTREWKSVGAKGTGGYGRKMAKEVDVGGFLNLKQKKKKKITDCVGILHPGRHFPVNVRNEEYTWTYVGLKDKVMKG